MNKEEKIKYLQRQLARYYEIKKQLEMVQQQEEVSFEQLREAFDSNNNRNILHHNKVFKSYEVIYGGDGRSSPWSSQAKGDVILIRISPRIYVSETNLKKLREYIRLVRTDSFDAIEII